MAIGINVQELYKILEVTPAGQNIMLVGKHGIGKSKIIETYFTEKGLPVTALFLGQMSDPGDLIGLPRLNEETGKTEFMPPFWFPTDGKPIVLFLDELNRARPEMLQTVMDLVLNRKLAGRSLPEGSRIVSAVNSGEEYQVGDLDPALVSRFNIYDLRPSAQDWLKWACKTGLDRRVTDFIATHPSLLDSRFNANADSLEKSPDRRAWERVARAIDGIDDIDNIIAKMIAGIIGAPATSEFITAINNKRISGADVLNSFDKVLPQLLKMPLEDFTVLNDDILDVINAIKQTKSYTALMADNFEAYIRWLLDSGKREAYAYFLNGLLSGRYPKAMTNIAAAKPALILEFNQFIENL